MPATLQDVPDWTDTTPKTNGNGRDPLSGMPWWMKAIILIGVPGAIALVLTYQSAFVLEQSVAINGQKLASMQADARIHDATAHAHFSESHAAIDEMTRIMMAQCVNAAQTTMERDRCAGMTR